MADESESQALAVILARVRCQAMHGQANGGRCVSCIFWAEAVGVPEHLPRLRQAIPSYEQIGGAAKRVVDRVFDDTEWWCADGHDWRGRDRLQGRLHAALTHNLSKEARRG